MPEAGKEKRLKIISWNVNGLRSVCRNGFLEWLKKEDPDVLCLQEIKIQEEQLPQEICSLRGYVAYYNTGARKGYAGVAVYTKETPKKVERMLGVERFDREGRFLRLDYAEFSVIALYVPQGGRDKRDLAYKLEVYDALSAYMKKLKNKKVFIAGDLNIAHTELDLARPKQNAKNIMFTPEERARLDAIMRMGFVDTFRIFHKEGGKYSWWPYFANARERNLGWRIDYVLASQALEKDLTNALILPDITGSDHCPIGVQVRFDKMI